jgi:tetratricopeptide (TPR) repeat protein
MDPTVYAWYERLRVNPDDAEALAYLWDYYAGRGEFQALAMLAEQIAGRRPDPVSAADLSYRAGEIWAKNVGRPDKAVACYKRAYEGDPSQVAALEAACQIYVQIGNHRAAAPLIERLLGTVTDPLMRLPRLREAAALYAQAGDSARRIACLEELYAGSPDDWDVTRDLAESLIARSQTPQALPDDGTRAAELLGTLAVAMGPEHGLAFAEIALDTHPGCELAYQVVHEAYGAANRVEELAVRQIAFVTSNPTSVYTPVIRRSLAEMYASVGQVDDAITCLEPLVNDDPTLTRQLFDLYRQAGRAADAAALLESLAVDSDDAQQVRDLKDLAALYGAVNDRPAMLDTMRKVLARSPADGEALTLLEDHLRQQGEHRELRDLWLRAIRSPMCPPEVRVPRLRDVGRVSAEALNDVDGAIEAWREVVETIPTDEEALKALGELLERAGRWEEYADVLGQRADLAADAGERRDVLERLAAVHRDRRDDPNAEAAVLAMLWETAPDDDGVAARLARARSDAGDLAGAADVQRARAERAQGATAVARWAEAGAAHEAAGQLVEAIAAWREVVSREPEHADGWPSVERLLAKSGQHQHLYATLVTRAEAMAEGSSRAAIHARAATAARAMGDGVAALAEAERAVAMAPDDDSLAGALFEALEASGQREKLLAFARDRSAKMSDGPAKVELLRRAARFVGATDPTAAAAVWEEVRTSSKAGGIGDDDEALEALMGLAELRGDHEGLAALYVEVAEAARDTAAKREILKRRAALLGNELGRPGDAVDALAAVAREHGADHAETWAELELMATAQGRHALAAEALERQVTLSPDEDEERRAALAAKLVELVEREVKEPAAIIHALEVQHRADPGDLGVIQRLADLCEHEGRYKDAVHYLDQLLEIEGDDEEISKLAQRIAHLSDTRLDDPQRAWDVLVAPVKTGDVACIEMMLDLANRHGLHAAVVPILAELAGRVSDRGGRSMLWREVARRKEEHLGDLEGAFEAWVTAAVAKADPAVDLERIDRLAEVAKRPQRVADAYKAALDACADPTLAHEVAMRGITAIERGGGKAQAFEFALAGLAKAPADDEILDAVVRLVPGPKRHTDIFVALDRRRRAAQNDGERFAVTLRAVETAGGVLGERETAFLYVEQAVGQAVGRKEPDEEMLARVENACIQGDQRRADAGMVSGLVERYAKLAEEASEDNPRVSAVLLRRAGTLCEHELGLMEEAFALYARAVTVWPEDVRGAGALEDAAGRMGRLGEVVQSYLRVIDEAYDARVARTYTGRRAALLADRLGRIEEAIDAYQRLVELAPKDVDVLHALQALLERHERWQQLLAAYERELEAGGDRVSLYRRIATVWETRLRNTFEAKDIWKRVLKLSPQDEEAKAAIQRLERRPTVIEDDLLAMEAPTPVPPRPEEPAPVVEVATDPPPVIAAYALPASEENLAAPMVEAVDVAAIEEVTGTAHAVAPVPDEPAPLLFPEEQAMAAVTEAPPAEAPTYAVAPQIAWQDPTPGRSFFDAPEVSAELVAVVEPSVPAWEAAESAPTTTPAEEPRSSMPPPYPRSSMPPSPPVALPVEDVSASEAVEVSIEEVAPADDDAPSLDDLAALTAMPAARTPVVTMPPETTPGSGRR